MLSPIIITWAEYKSFCFFDISNFVEKCCLFISIVGMDVKVIRFNIITTTAKRISFILESMLKFMIKGEAKVRCILSNLMPFGYVHLTIVFSKACVHRFLDISIKITPLNNRWRKKNFFLKLVLYFKCGVNDWISQVVKPVLSR